MKTLMGAVAHSGRIEAVHRNDLGVVGHKSSDWPGDALDAADGLVQACATVLAAPVKSVQVYTAITDPDGTAHSAPGALVDVTLTAGGTTRIGDAGAVPEGIATARDTLKAAIETALAAEPDTAPETPSEDAP